jgi:hypothetical protein
MTRSPQDTIAILAYRNGSRKFLINAVMEHNTESQPRPLAPTNVVAIDVERNPKPKIQTKITKKTWLQRVALL